MKKLNMMKKITLAFGVVIVCFIIALVFNVLGMINTANKYSTFYTMRHEATMRARNIRINVQSTTKNVLYGIVEGEESYIDSGSIRNLTEIRLRLKNLRRRWTKSQASPKSFSRS